MRRLRTDHVDVYFNHAVHDPARLRKDDWYEFAGQAKSQGKIRFSGISDHGGRLVECLDYAIDHDLVDVIPCAWNFGQDPVFHQRFVSRLDFVAVQTDLPRVLAKARAKDIGVIAMKNLRGARRDDMRPFETGGETFAQAGFRWTLSDPKIDALRLRKCCARECMKRTAETSTSRRPSTPGWVSRRRPVSRARQRPAQAPAHWDS